MVSPQVVTMCFPLIVIVVAVLTAAGVVLPHVRGSARADHVRVRAGALPAQAAL